jgi:hypothetical protein
MLLMNSTDILASRYSVRSSLKPQLDSELNDTSNYIPSAQPGISCFESPQEIE